MRNEKGKPQKRLPLNCNLTKNFTVIENTAPEITFIKVEELTAEISIIGTGIYEYSLDNIHFQSSPIFNFIVGGVYTCYVKEIGTNCYINDNKRVIPPIQSAQPIFAEN